jgi:hypothetical protein
VQFCIQRHTCAVVPNGELTSLTSSGPCHRIVWIRVHGWATGWTNRVWFLSTLPAVRPTQSPVQWLLESLCRWLKLPGRKADHSSPTSAEAKNGGAIPPLHNTLSFLLTIGLQMAVRLSVLRAGRCLPQGRFLVLISVRGWVDSRAIVRLEGLGKLKNPVTSSQTEPLTFRLVA